MNFNSERCKMLSTKTAKISILPLKSKRPYYVDDNGMLYHQRSDGVYIQRVPTNSGRSMMVNYQVVNLSKELQQLFISKFGEGVRTISNVQLAEAFFCPLDCQIVSYITADRESSPQNWLERLPEQTELYVHSLGLMFPSKTNLIDYVNKKQIVDELQVFILAGTIKCTIKQSMTIEVV